MANTLPTVELPSGVIECATYGPADSTLPPIVFMHGAVVDHRLWEPVAELLAERGHRCHVPLMPLGSHRIPWGPDADRSPRGASRLLREFVGHLDLSSAVLVANDTGGAVTQFALDEDPHFVRRLVFTNCDAFDLFPPQPFRLYFALMRQRLLLKPLVDAMRLKALRHSPLGVGLLLHDPDPDLTASVFAPLQSDARIRDDFIAFLREINPAELATVTARMSRVDLPVRFVWGRDDRCFTPEHGRRFASVFPGPDGEGARFVEIPGARTFVSLDQPHAVASAIAAFATEASNR
ncbi:MULTISPECIES: alpha/beta fold hydrolase [Gordonia]|jgi:pimeloyl-ACP methyl ester carboxylesterase|uniref:Putative hydrolase n=1 Tax=Gordonia alkanivorans NBRC 16433 TaxID=1027371 RepID=F9VUH1_9ACTN|nr:MULTISPECIES: alpha/beta hydrolase [Gordonia]MDH3005868.1 alpha/beta hydrolase [Gordonia alkanivorans]MDH3016161.1 alpha/beta hydrolase [Gordonia alkanivorans]MDH3019731.1 alpha/beta hydrolase [Gordonia alkanivorans]MDH3024524.1 alpha/beta hydrolase [Gordonia alkanivorans]MDH3041001.1 alpha/beta hydrolase [Gordonia alkanivorans]